METAAHIPLVEPDHDLSGDGPDTGRSKAALAPARNPRGVVYTKPWVVDLILDLVGYRSCHDLAERYAVEPAAGEGAFLLPMIRRLLASLEAHGRQLTDVEHALHAYEIDASVARRLVDLATRELLKHGAPARQARELAEGWVTTGDYLLNVSKDRSADMVVGNPPYIRYDDLPAGVFARYRRVLPTMVGRGDIYVGFFEAGLRQLRQGGALGFICADRWMRSAYGVELRRLISAGYSMEAVIEMHDAPAFEENVSAYPAVITIRRASQGSTLVASGGATAGPAPGGRNLADGVIDLADRGQGDLPGFSATRVADWVKGSSPWPSLQSHRLELLRHLEERYRPLEDEYTGTKVGIGVATGADRVYVTQDASLVEPERLLPLAMSEDTRDGVVNWSGHYLVNPWQANGNLVDLDVYPRLRQYLEARRDALERRHIVRNKAKNWYRTIDRVNHRLIRQDKLYFPDMKLMSNPTLDVGKTYPHHNLYYLTSDLWDLEVLGGLLLSKVAELFIEAYCVKMRGGTLRFQAQYLRRIRVPDPALLTPSLNERLRHAFQTRDAQAATSAAVEAYGIDDRAAVFGC